MRKPIVALFQLVLETRGIKLAGATKLLYPFRPKLFAVLDSVLENYYWYATSISDSKQFRTLQSTQWSENPWGEYVFELLSLLRDDIRYARRQIDELRKLCVEKDYADAPRVRILESLIWYYYAREGRQAD